MVCCGLQKVPRTLRNREGLRWFSAKRLAMFPDDYTDEGGPMPPDEVVITGLGVVSPIGIGKRRVWESFCAGRSGVRPIRRFDPAGLPVRIAAGGDDFDPEAYVTPRKKPK